MWRAVDISLPRVFCHDCADVFGIIQRIHLLHALGEELSGVLRLACAARLRSCCTGFEQRGGIRFQGIELSGR